MDDVRCEDWVVLDSVPAVDWVGDYVEVVCPSHVCDGVFGFVIELWVHVVDMPREELHETYVEGA